jgi:prepilin-type processing-associated H-X9-DG protein
MMAFTAFVFALTTAQGPAPDLKRDVLLTDKEAIFLLDPEVVAGPGASGLQWSPDGTFLIVQKQHFAVNPLTLLAQGKLGADLPPGERQILIHSVPSRRTVLALRLPLSARITQVAWLAGSSKALILADVPAPPALGEAAAGMVDTLYWVSAGGESRAIAQAGQDEMLRLFVAPNRPLAAVSRVRFQMRPGGVPQRHQTVQFIDGEAKPVGKVEFDDAANEIEWGADGAAYALITRIENRRAVLDRYRLSPSQGRAVKVDDWQASPEKARPAPEFLVGDGSLPLTMKNFPPVKIVFMADQKHPDSPILVTSDGDHAVVSPNGSAVAYVHHGVAMVRPFARVPKEAYIQMRDAAAKAEAVSVAKQAALAHIMYAADNDDNLIANSGEWRDTIMPYIKNREMLDKFVYTFAGGSMTAIESPAETEIGYVPGPGGRAVAYADGHVKWKPDGK